jgi:hypothetical protein
MQRLDGEGGLAPVRAVDLRHTHRIAVDNDLEPAGVIIPEVQVPGRVGVRIVKPGSVQFWSAMAARGAWVEYLSGFAAGQSFVLNPGDRVRLTYTDLPTWRWKPIR